jgi:hypothetical protein
MDPAPKSTAAVAALSRKAVPTVSELTPRALPMAEVQVVYTSESLLHEDEEEDRVSSCVVPISLVYFRVVPISLVSDFSVFENFSTYPPDLYHILR